jgi:hypothetical protein
MPAVGIRLLVLRRTAHPGPSHRGKCSPEPANGSGMGMGRASMAHPCLTNHQSVRLTRVASTKKTALPHPHFRAAWVTAATTGTNAVVAKTRVRSRTIWRTGPLLRKGGSVSLAQAFSEHAGKPGHGTGRPVPLPCLCCLAGPYREGRRRLLPSGDDGTLAECCQLSQCSDPGPRDAKCGAA